MTTEKRCSLLSQESLSLIVSFADTLSGNLHRLVQNLYGKNWLIPSSGYVILFDFVTWLKIY